MLESSEGRERRIRLVVVLDKVKRLLIDKAGIIDAGKENG